jgi:formamidopyrimidine-DNA glycosylase
VVSRSRTDRRHRWTLSLLFATLAGVWACGALNNRQGSDGSAQSRWGTPAVFTTAHTSFSSAVRDYFGIRDEARQPFDFSHQLHLSKELLCTDCHSGVEKGPVAGIPSVSTCMICHSQIATDRPLIKTLTELQSKGLDLPWQRVYSYAPEAHVRFDHAPHIRAKVECSTCHGNLTEQTVARRVVNLSMSFCVNCHRAKQVSNDCLTCHY